MKTITINVSEPVYREYQEYAKVHDRTASELIRQAMEEFLTLKMSRKTSMRDLRPISLGKILGNTMSREDLLPEMLDDNRD